MRREDLHQADQRAGDAGDDQGDGERAKRELGPARAARRRGDRDDEHRRRGSPRPTTARASTARAEEPRGERADGRERHRREQRQRAARSRPRRAGQTGGEDDHEAAPADQRRRLVEERRRRCDVERDQGRHRDGEHRADAIAAGTGAGAGGRAAATARGPLQGSLTVTGDAIRLGSRWCMAVLASKRGMIRARHPEPMSATPYRPDIDGLRAVAVLAVVVYHAWPHALPGGFVGVDVFFVISGYLITRILLAPGVSFAETSTPARAPHLPGAPDRPRGDACRRRDVPAARQLPQPARPHRSAAACSSPTSCRTTTSATSTAPPS